MTDEIKEGAVQYLSKNETDKNRGDEVVLGKKLLPEDNVLKSAVLTAIRHRSIEACYKAFRGIIEEETRILLAHDQFDEARLKRVRTVKRLDDVESILAADKDQRDAVAINAKQQLIFAQRQLLEEEQRLKKAKHQISMDEKLEEMEQENTRREHAKFMNPEEEKEQEEDTSAPSPEDQETKDWMMSKVLRGRKVKTMGDEIRSEYDLTEQELQNLTALEEEEMNR